MSIHTTLTDIRRIMKFHAAGVTIEKISAAVFIPPDEVESIIKIKSGTKKKAKKKVEIETPLTDPAI